MKVLKGTECKTLCCKRRYTSQFDFEPSTPPLVMDGITYVRGECFGCLLKSSIALELAKHEIDIVK